MSIGKGWRTIAFNVLAVIAPVLEGAGMDLGLSGIYLTLYSSAWGIGNLFLRSITNTSVGKSSNDPRK